MAARNERVVWVVPGRLQAATEMRRETFVEVVSEIVGGEPRIWEEEKGGWQ